VGIDIEEKSATPRTSTRFLTQNEQKMLESGTAYLEIWTKKEALFKFLKNDSLPLPTIDSATPEKYGATLDTRETDEYYLTVCTEK
jgi:phosphopantetheinyl transferase